MPTYDYKCDGCGHTFEEWQSFKDDVLTQCPACKKKKLRRLFGGGAGIIFKGSGFYETDYRRPDAERKAKASGEKVETDAKPADGKPADNGTPAAKADAAPASSSPPPPPASPPPPAAPSKG